MLLLPLLLFPGVLAGRVISADDHLSVHHVAQDAAGGHVRNPALSDPGVQFTPLRARVVTELRAGRAPLWNPDLYGGVPLLADGQSMVGSPFTWLHVVLPRGLAQTLGALGILWVLGLGTWGTARGLGLSPTGAAVAVAAAQTGPFVSVWLLHPHAATLCWLPLACWGAERLRAGGRGGVLVLGVGLILAGGHPATAVHAVFAATLYALIRAPQARTIGALFAGVLVAAPIWLPMLAFIQGSATADAHGGNRLLLGQLLDLVWPGFWGHPATEAGYRGPGVWADGVLHPGLGALGLSVWAVIKGRGRGLAGAWVAAVVVACVGLPLLNNARLGAEAAWLLALVAGMGVDAVPARWGPVFLGVVGATGVWARWRDQGTLEQLPEPAAWTVELAERTQDARVVGLGWAVQPNTGMWAGLRDVRGYDLPVSRETETYMAMLDPRVARPWFPIEAVRSTNRTVLEFSAVRYVLAPEPQYGLAEVDLGVPTPLHVYALDDDAPRAWCVNGARPASSALEAQDFLRSGYAHRSAPAVEGLSRRWPERGEVVPVPVQDLGRELRLDAPGDCVLVVADRWEDDWEATIDGQDAPLLRVGGLFRGLEMPPQGGAVVMRYAPRSWRNGWVLAAIGWLGTLMLAAVRSAPRGKEVDHGQG